MTSDSEDSRCISRSLQVLLGVRDDHVDLVAALTTGAAGNLLRRVDIALALDISRPESRADRSGNCVSGYLHRPKLPDLQVKRIETMGMRLRTIATVPKLFVSVCDPHERGRLTRCTRLDAFGSRCDACPCQTLSIGSIGRGSLDQL